MRAPVGCSRAIRKSAGGARPPQQRIDRGGILAFECRLDRVVDFGDGPSGSNVVFGTILCAHVSEAVLGADGQIDPHKLDTIGRMGGDHYVRTTELFTIVRPR